MFHLGDRKFSAKSEVFIFRKTTQLSTLIRQTFQLVDDEKELENLPDTVAVHSYTNGELYTRDYDPSFEVHVIMMCWKKENVYAIHTHSRQTFALFFI